MYKGIVLKIYKNYAIILTDDGDYKRIKRKDKLLVGRKIIFLDEDIMTTRQDYFRPLAFIAAVLIIMVTIFTNLPTDPTYALVSIDINPSLDLKIGLNNQVIEIITLNEDADNIVSQEMIGLDVLVVINQIIRNAEDLNYITNENNHILVSTADMEKDDLHDLSQLVSTFIENDLVLKSNVKIIFLKSDKATAEESIKTGVSLGRLEVSKMTQTTDQKEDVKEITKEIEEGAIIIDDSPLKKELNSLIDFMSKEPEKYKAFLDKVSSSESALETLVEEAKELLGFDILYDEIDDLIKNIQALEPDQEIKDLLASYESMNLNDYERLLAFKNSLIRAERNLLNTVEKNKQINQLRESIEELKGYSTEAILDFLEDLDEEDIVNDTISTKQEVKKLLIEAKQALRKKEQDLKFIQSQTNRLKRFESNEDVEALINLISELTVDDSFDLEDLKDQVEDLLEKYNNQSSQRINQQFLDKYVNRLKPYMHEEEVKTFIDKINLGNYDDLDDLKDEAEDLWKKYKGKPKDRPESSNKDEDDVDTDKENELEADEKKNDFDEEKSSEEGYDSDLNKLKDVLIELETYASHTEVTNFIKQTRDLIDSGSGDWDDLEDQAEDLLEKYEESDD